MSIIQSENDIHEVILKYIKSIEDVNIDLVDEIWLDSDETTIIYPRNVIQGIDSIKENFYKEILLEKFLATKLTTHDFVVKGSEDIMVVEFKCHFLGMGKENKELYDSKGTCIQIYTNIKNQWKLRCMEYLNFS